MKRYGLIGYPLGHSFSKNYFDAKFASEGLAGVSFENFEIEDLAGLKNRLGDDIHGFTVTIPHKRNIIPLLSRIDPAAEAAGAVNCVKVEADGSWTGYNTDVTGFERSLLDMLGAERPAALVFGSGGASAAVRYVLDGLGVDFATVSRSEGGGAILYGQVDPGLIKERKLLVNTTPLGMYPAGDDAVDIPYEALTGDHYLYDLVYNPAETLFMRLGRRRGARVKNGLQMLRLQAEAAWDVWNSC